MEYIIQTERLGLRNWKESDLTPLVALNQDAEVMRYFPSLMNAEKTREFIKRMQKQFHQKNHCYFAVDRLDQQKFIGFIGIAQQDYESAYTPAIDIGWRLKRSAWGQGFATEGAKAALDYAFDKIDLSVVISIAPALNLPSQKVMKKIGMTKIGSFDHPMLMNHPKLKKCVVFERRKTMLPTNL